MPRQRCLVHDQLFVLQNLHPECERRPVQHYKINLIGFKYACQVAKDVELLFCKRTFFRQIDGNVYITKGSRLLSRKTPEQIGEKDILIGTEIFKRPGQ
jgi:hypothetical protein